MFGWDDEEFPEREIRCDQCGGPLEVVMIASVVLLTYNFNGDAIDLDHPTRLDGSVRPSFLRCKKCGYEYGLLPINVHPRSTSSLLAPG